MGVPQLKIASFLWHKRESRKTWDEPPHDKTNKMAGAPSEDSDQPESDLFFMPTSFKYPHSREQFLFDDY